MEEAYRKSREHLLAISDALSKGHSAVIQLAIQIDSLIEKTDALTNPYQKP